MHQMKTKNSCCFLMIGANYTNWYCTIPIVNKPFHLWIYNVAFCLYILSLPQPTHFVCFFSFFFYSAAKWLWLHSPPSRPFQQFFTTDIISPHQNQYYFSTRLALPSFTKALSFYVVYARKEHGFAFHFQIFDHRFILNYSNFSEVTYTVRRLIQYVWIAFYFL